MAISLVKPYSDTHKEQVIEQLERLLEEAKEGKISTLICAYKIENSYEYCWTGCENLIEIAGLITRMAFLNNKRMEY